MHCWQYHIQYRCEHMTLFWNNEQAVRPNILYLTSRRTCRNPTFDGQVNTVLTTLLNYHTLFICYDSTILFRIHTRISVYLWCVLIWFLFLSLPPCWTRLDGTINTWGLRKTLPHCPHTDKNTKVRPCHYQIVAQYHTSKQELLVLWHSRHRRVKEGHQHCNHVLPWSPGSALWVNAH